MNDWTFCGDVMPEPAENVLLYYERDAWGDGDLPYRKREIGVVWHVDGRWHVDMCSKVVGIAWISLPDPPEV